MAAAHIAAIFSSSPSSESTWKASYCEEGRGGEHVGVSSQHGCPPNAVAIIPARAFRTGIHAGNGAEE